MNIWTKIPTKALEKFMADTQFFLETCPSQKDTLPYKDQEKRLEQMKEALRERDPKNTSIFI